MKRNRQEWTDAVGTALRDAEATPPRGGWERLAGALAEADRRAAAGAFAARPGRRIGWRRAVSIAAALAVVVAGGYSWRAADRLPSDGFSAADPIAGAWTSVAAKVVPLRADDAPQAAELALAVPQRREGAGVFGGTMRAASPAVEPFAEAAEAAGFSGEAAEIAAEVAQTSSEDAQAKRVRPEASRDESAAGGAASGARQPDSAAAQASDAASRSRASAGRAAGDRPTAKRSGAEPAARQRSSFAVHAGGVPRGSRGGDADVPMGDAVAPDVSTVTLFAHAPGDVMSNVVKTAPLRVPRPVEYRHLQPVSVGLAVRWGFSRGLSLAAGANYTLLRSEARLEGSGRWVDQRLHFVGLPVRLDWQYLEHGPLSLYIGAGGQVEKCVAARLDGQRVDEPGVQWSLTAAAGVQCGLGGVVALYAEPEAAWYVNDTRLRTSRTDHPLSFTLRFGVRFSF